MKHELNFVRDALLEEWRGGCTCGEPFGSSPRLADIGGRFDHHIEDIGEPLDAKTPTPTVIWGEDGQPRWIHKCKQHLDEYRIDARRWSWNREANTVTPALACGYCGTEGNWVKGSWEPA